ncbi:signal recognition particle protein [Candidatus Amarolinea aalborgensis]|uniref:signal recognition particle protein n=1 Tax=Candidatus Amarolinea aalborgensis TaxID=2249329 RepID=UPI003BF99F61
MFETLTDKLQAIFDKLSSQGRLSEADVDKALREVRMALLEADVNFKVVKAFVARIRERAVGVEVMQSLTPAQQVVKIVHEELITMLGEPGKLTMASNPPTVIMMVGLQGSGKTTTAAKLALRLRKAGQRPLLVAADTYRPAAITQLEVLGKQLDIPVHSEGNKLPPPQICANAVQRAKEGAYNVVILDTAGRLQIDDTMMAELEQVKARTKPNDILLVVDAMTGQEAVRVAEGFHTRVGITGLILTKVDGDARGGAALSIREVTGVPIKFLGIGEKTDALEPYHPDRLASRILGMGDVLTLIEKAESSLDKTKAEAMGKRLMKGDFDLEDFLGQMREIRKLGPLSQLMDMIPGMSRMSKEIAPEVTDGQMKSIEAMICSMTTAERRDPDIINGSRKRRIARGSGTTVAELNDLLSQFRQMQRLMKQMSNQRRGRGGLQGLLGMLR